MKLIDKKTALTVEYPRTGKKGLEARMQLFALCQEAGAVDKSIAYTDENYYNIIAKSLANEKGE